MIALIILIAFIPAFLYFFLCYLAARRKLGWFFSENTRTIYEYLFTQDWQFDTHHVVMGDSSNRYKLRTDERPLMIWIANGPWFCDPEGQFKNTFGILERHFVYAAISRIIKLKRKEILKSQLDKIKAKAEN